MEQRIRQFHNMCLRKIETPRKFSHENKRYISSVTDFLHLPCKLFRQSFKKGTKRNIYRNKLNTLPRAFMRKIYPIYHRYFTASGIQRIIYNSDNRVKQRMGINAVRREGSIQRARACAHARPAPMGRAVCTFNT